MQLRLKKTKINLYQVNRSVNRALDPTEHKKLIGLLDF